MSEQYKYNVAVIGKTGVGKSSFINYLYGDKTCETGIGKPVTKNGFHAIETKIKGLPVIIFDSWGLEADKWEEWSSDLDAELKKRSAEKPASEWFHSVFYCIQAGGARIEPADEKIIQKLLKEHYKISIVLTKADQLDEDDEAKFIHVIKQSFPLVSVLPVCSEGKKTRGGEVKPFGKEQVEMKAYEDFFDSLIMRLPILCKSTLHKIRDEFLREARDYIDGIGIFGFFHNDDEVRERLLNKSKNLPNDLEKNNAKVVNDSLKMFQYFSYNLGYSYSLDHLQDMRNRIYEDFVFKKKMASITIPSGKIETPLLSRSEMSGTMLILELLYRKYKAAKDEKQELRNIIDKVEVDINGDIDYLISSVELHLERVKSQRLIGYSK